MKLQGAKVEFRLDMGPIRIEEDLMESMISLTWSGVETKIHLFTPLLQPHCICTTVVSERDIQVSIDLNFELVIYPSFKGRVCPC